MRSEFLFFLILILPSWANAQVKTEVHFDLESFVEQLVAIPSEELDYDELYENLLLNFNNPLNLNGADREELARLYILTDIQINALLNHISINGPLISLYEIQSIPYFDKKTISQVIHFVKVAPTKSPSSKSLTKNLFGKGNNYLLFRYDQTLEKRKGYRELQPETDGSLSKAYRGSPGRYNFRFRSQKAGDYKFGINLEKDAGEALQWNSNNGTYGADSYNIYYQVLNKGRFKNMIIGDYQLQFGQGLILSGGFSLGKGAETITSVKRPNGGIRPHTSQLETGFLRGLANTYQINRSIEMTTFFSRTLQDAILLDDSIKTSSGFVKSVQTSGLHRTESEIKAKNTLTQQTYGGNISFYNLDKSLQVGLTSVVSRFSLPIIRDDKPVNRFQFQGDENINYGLNLSYRWENFTFFTEAAQSNSRGKGIVGGFLSSLSRQLSLSFLIRHYDRDFHSLFGQGFAESSGNNSNEQGIYLGIKYDFSRRYGFTGYFDQFKFPWITTRINRPSDGYEYLIRGSYTPTKSTELHLQFRQESKARNTNQNQNVTVAKQGIKNNYQLSFNRKLSDKSGFKSRIQFSNYTLNDIRTTGFAVAQDAYYHFGKFKLAGRIALFDTEDFENRQYIYERDVLYAFSLPAYSGVGSRKYLLIQYNFSSNIKAWIRWANTTFRDRDIISSGQQEIQGNKQNDIKMQLQISF